MGNAGILWIFAGENGCSGGRADGGIGVPVGEADAGCGEGVDVWGFDVAAKVAAEVAYALIVGVDDDEVGLLSLRGRKWSGCGEGC